jgi:hypothetical protein
MKIVINRSHGGFCLSDEARTLLFTHKANHVAFVPLGQVGNDEEDLPGRTPFTTETVTGYLSDDFRMTWGADQGRRRADPRLVAVVEALGERASAPGAKLIVVEVPDGVDWVIHESDGKEQIRSKEDKVTNSQTGIGSPEPSVIPPESVRAESLPRQEIEYFL